MDGKFDIMLREATLLMQKALRDASPIRTGNLRYNAIRMIPLGNYKYKIVIDENIAPYAPYTNGPWIAERWHGHKNPNEGWIDRGVQKGLQLIAQRYNGKIVKR